MFDSSHYISIILVSLWLFNIAMGNGPFIDGLPIKNGDFPWLCQITRGYMAHRSPMLHVGPSDHKKKGTFFATKTAILLVLSAASQLEARPGCWLLEGPNKIDIPA